MYCTHLLRPPNVGFMYNARHGYRVRFLRDFNKQDEPKLRTVPTKWWGRVQWWREPIYVAPHVNVLQKGIDFTFQDGRPVHKKIVKLLSEVNEAEEMYKRQLETEKQKNERRLAIAPLPKGMQEIS